MINTAIEGNSHARFCALSGKFCKTSGKTSAKEVTLMPSIIPNANATAVTGATICDGFFQNFQKKLKIITTIAGG